MKLVIPLVPQDLVTEEDIRYARLIDLSRLTGLDSASFVGWTAGRSMTEKSLSRIAEVLGVKKAVVLHGMELRRQDFARTQAVSAKLTRLQENRTADSA